jgi:hypothetical protein
VFNTLTEFFAWLSVNQAEGNNYWTLASALAYPQDSKNPQPEMQALQVYLTQHLAAPKVALLLNAIRANDAQAIPQAINAEQTDTVHATFSYTSLIWCLPRR